MDSLIVDANFIGEAGLEALEKLGCPIDSGEQKDLDADDLSSCNPFFGLAVQF